MTDKLNTAPVALAAGSYDYDALSAGLNEAAGAGEGYDASIDQALHDARGGKVHLDESSATPGYRTKKVHNHALGVDEHIQVPSHKVGEEVAEGEGEATLGAEDAEPAKRVTKRGGSPTGAGEPATTPTTDSAGAIDAGATA